MTTKIKPMTSNEAFVFVAALRYSFGRHTYALGLVADEIIATIPRMDEMNIKEFLREIDMRRGMDRDFYGEPDAIERGNLARLGTALTEALHDDERR